MEGVEARQIELLRLLSERLIRKCFRWSGPGRKIAASSLDRKPGRWYVEPYILPDA